MRNHTTDLASMPGRLVSSVVLFVGLGVIVALLNVMAWSHLADTWWANFIYLTALSLWVGAWLGRSASTGRWQILGQLCLSAGAIVFTLATILLFEAMAVGWPLMALIPGLAVLWHSLTLKRSELSPEWQAWLRTFGWWGSVVAAVGLVFWLILLGLLPIGQLVGDFQWWGVIMILVGLGAIWNAGWLYQQVQQRLTSTVVLLGGLGLVTCIEGFLEIINIL